MKPPPVTFTRAAMSAAEHAEGEWAAALGDGDPEAEAVLARMGPPPNHLRHVIGEAVAAFDRADFQTGLTNLCHAVYVAGTTGREGMSEMDLIRELRKVAGFGFDVGEAPCP